LKIHSSSLHIPSSGHSANKPKQAANNSQENVSASDNRSQQPSNNQAFVSAKQEEAKQQLNQVSQLEQTSTTLNTKNAKALAAYTDTFNDFIHQQVSAKITGIDFYV